MADEVFALSPISARAAQPSEADYEAIREAFMETSRGRWFLGEYAKRNRNADTSMVLDAVSRIEEALATQKQAVRDEALDRALAAIRAALGEARAAAEAALGELALPQNLAPVRKGARVIREIAWRLREIGADGRICDLIDSQVVAVEAAAARIAATDPASGLSGAFDLIEGQIAAFDGSDAADSAPASPPEIVEEIASSPVVAEPAAATPVPAVQAFDAPAEAPAAMAHEPPAASAGPEAEAMIADPAPAENNEAAVMAESAAEPVDAFEADDEAVLELIALEMAAPDSDDAYDPTRGKIPPGADESFEIDVTYAAEVSEPTPARPAQAPPTMAEASLPMLEAAPVPSAVRPEPAVEPKPAPPQAEPAPIPAAVQPEPAPSLGSSLLANGIVPRPRTSKPDPLAPIRRMSQAEKIAFFS